MTTHIVFTLSTMNTAIVQCTQTNISATGQTIWFIKTLKKTLAEMSSSYYTVLWVPMYYLQNLQPCLFVIKSKIKIYHKEF